MMMRVASVVLIAQTQSSSQKKVNKSVALFLYCGIELATMHGFAGAFRYVRSCVRSYVVGFFYVAYEIISRIMRQVAQSSLNYGWGCGKISVANDATVNLKGDSHGSEEKSSKEKSS